MGMRSRFVSLGVAIGAAAVGHAGAQPLFRDETASRGLLCRYSAPPTAAPAQIHPMTGGAAAGDFNRDGWQDLFVLAGGAEPDQLFINNGDGTFTNRASEFGVDYAHHGSAVAVGDVNGDGWLDIYITSFGPANADFVTGAHLLYINQGGTSFREVAQEAGVAQTSPTIPDGFGAAFGDYDLDGDLDLAVAGWTRHSHGNRLFRNDGPTPDAPVRFTDVTADLRHDMAVVEGFAPRFVDVDGDRWPELLWVADFFSSCYFVNNRDGTFTERSDDAGVGIESNGMGSAIGDINADGRLDWYVTSIHSEVIGYNRGNALYINQGGHRFGEEARQRRVDDGGWGWGAAIGDYNLDGRPDIIETNGFAKTEWIDEPSYLFLQSADGRFVSSGPANGLDHTGYGRGLVQFDPDNDGDLDIVIISTAHGGEVFPSLNGRFVDPGQMAFFANAAADESRGSWIRIFCDTAQTRNLAPDGIGTRIAVTAGGVTRYAWIDSNITYLSQNELSAHLGLADADTIDSIRIEWPDGRDRVVTGVPINTTVTLTACAADYTGDHALTMDDVLGFLDAFTARHRSADLDATGDFDFFDVAEFVRAFRAGCPSDR